MNEASPLEALSRIFERNAARPLLVLPDDRTLTYGQFWSMAGQMARRLRELGAPEGSRLLIQLENSETLLELYLACAIGGLVACPIDPDLPGPRVAAIKAVLEPALHLTAADLPGLLTPPGAGGAPLPPPQADAEFLIIQSSGTTGEPKGIIHTLRSMVASSASFATLSGMNRDSVAYHHFPMFYMAGIFNLFFCPLQAEGTLVLGPKFSRIQMLRFWELPMRHGVNCLTLTPTMAHSLCRLYRRDDRLQAHLQAYQSIVSTGSPLYGSVAERFLASFGVPLRTCYGVTEVGGTITFQSWEDAMAFQSMGSAAPGTEIRAGQAGAPGEILVKTPFMAKGYLVKGRIVDPFDADGFFHTGDLGEVRDGLLFYQGREHDLIKKGGEFISTTLIEDLALRNPQVSEVAAVGVPDEFWGSRIVLFYVPQADADELGVTGAFARLFTGGLREIERPDKMIPVPWMPKTSIGKIIKRELVERYDVRRHG